MSSPDDKSKPAPPEAPKTDRTQRVPSFSELHGPLPPLGEEEKTAQISPELLQRALAQTQGPPRTSSTTQTKAAPLGPLPPQAVPPRAGPPPPAVPRSQAPTVPSRPGTPQAPAPVTTRAPLAISPETAFPDERTSPVFERPRLSPNPVAPPAQVRRASEPPTLDTTPDEPRPAVPSRGATSTPARAPMAAPAPRTEGNRPTSQRLPMPAPAGDVTPEDRPGVARASASRPEVRSQLTERVPPLTPDLLPGPKVSPGRPVMATLSGAPAAPRPDPSQVPTLAPPPPASRRDKQAFGVPNAGASPGGPEEPAHGVSHTQPSLPPYSPRGAEPASGDHRAAALPPEGPTRNERSVRGPDGLVSFDLAQQIDSELRKMPKTDPGAGNPAVDDRDEPEPATGRVDALEVIAHPAPLWRRAFALLVDGVLLSALFTIVSVVVLILGKAPRLPDGLSMLDMLAVRLHDSGKLCAAVLVMALGIATSYSTLFAAAFRGRTLGRTLLDITLVDARGTTPGPVRALTRAVFSVLSFAAMFAGFWWSLFDRKGQTLHDKLCATYVVRFGARRT